MGHSQSESKNGTGLEFTLFNKHGVPIDIILIICFTLLVIWSVFMNSTVIVALVRGVLGFYRKFQENRRFRKEGRPEVTSPKEFINWCDVYFASMDCVDCSSGLLLFPPMAIMTLIGYFPFGEFVCDFWIFLELFLLIWGAFGYALISINYIWMVRWPRSFVRSTWATHLKIMSLGIALVLPVIIPPYIIDRRESKMVAESWKKCGFIYDNGIWNQYLGVIGLYIPLLISIGGAQYVFLEWRRHKKVSRISTSSSSSSISEIDDLWARPVKNGAIPLKNAPKVHNLWSHQIDQLAFIGYPNELQKFWVTPQLKHPQIRTEVVEEDTLSEDELVLKCQKASMEHVPALLGMLTLFFFCRISFYIYYAGITFNIGGTSRWTTDLSNWVFWVIHSNSPLSPIVHLSFDPKVRGRVFKLLRIDKFLARNDAKLPNGNLPQNT